MKCHWLYLKYILRHKWYVFLGCYKAGIFWRGIIHDWHKFLPSEWFPYVHYFYSESTDTSEEDFDFAWLLHQKRARHHWQWWILPEDDGDIKIMSMSDVSRREMLCDWRGAGRAVGKPDTLGWYKVNKAKMQLHPATRKWIEEQLYSRRLGR